MFNFLGYVFFNSFSYEFTIEIIKSNGKNKSNKSSAPGRKPPDYSILDSCWVFEKFVLVDDPIAKALQMPKTFVSVNNKYVKK